MRSHLFFALSLLLATPGFAEAPAASAKREPSPVAPNLYGQTGIKRITSARTGPHASFDLGLHARGFYLPDFIGPDADEGLFGAGLASFGVALFDVMELSLATQVASAYSSFADPSTVMTSGDLYPSLKLGYTFLPVSFAVDLRASLPSSFDGLGPDLANFGLNTTALLTLDLADAYGIPVRAHLNGGYGYQHARNAADPQRYYLRGMQGQLVGLATSSWYYDQLSYGAGVEVPLPYVTLFTELWGQMSLGVVDTAGPGGGPYGLGDSHLTLTPGVRVTALPGLAIDLASDVGLLGTGGLFAPQLGKLTAGQPVNPAYAVHLAVSWTFEPFGGSPGGAFAGAAARGGASLGGVEGCVSDSAQERPIEEAYVDFGGGVRLVTDASGCFRAPSLRAGEHTVSVSHPDFDTQTLTVEVRPGDQARADVTLVASPAATGLLRGSVFDMRNDPVTAQLLLEGGPAGEAVIEVNKGVFEAELPPGRYQAVVKAPGFLQQGAQLSIEEGGRTVRSFTLKPEPKKRIARVAGDRIELRTGAPFQRGEPRLLAAAEFILDDLVDLLLAEPGIGRVRVEGTQGGGKELGEELARARAEAVVDYLVGRGVPAERLEAGVAERPDKPRGKGGVQLLVVGADVGGGP